MKLVLKLLGVLLGALAIFAISIGLASESGEEIVVLRTSGADGSPASTRLWVVEDAGFPWLRAGDSGSGWLQRIENEPQVVVTRGDQDIEYLAIPVRDPAMRDRIHSLMREKYGLADRVVSLLGDRSQSVPVRLEQR